MRVVITLNDKLVGDGNATSGAYFERNLTIIVINNHFVLYI